MFWRRHAIRVLLVIGLGVVALVVVTSVTGATSAEDPAIQRDMAASYAAKVGVSVDQAQAQLERQDRLIPVADRIRETLGKAYAGIWFDQTDGSRMKIGITATVSAQDPALVQKVEAILATNGATDDADLVQVDATQAELAAEQDKVNAALADHLRAGDVQTSLDPTTNSVVVTESNALSSADRADIDALVSAASAKARIVSAPSSSLRMVLDTLMSRRGTVTHLREVDAPWRLAAVRAHGRVLVLRYDASGCLRGDGRAVVTASRRRVVIHVREHEVVAGDSVNGVKQACTDEQYTPTLRVRLAAPLAGRPVVGGPRLPRP